MHECPAFLRGLRGQERSFRAGERLDAPGLCLVQQGIVGIWRDGLCLWRAMAGDSFGETSLFRAEAAAQAVAEQDGKLLHFPARGLLLHVRAHGDLALAFADFTSRQLDEQRMWSHILRLKGAEERILTHLHALGAHTKPVEIAGTLHGWAVRLGLTHEALYRSLASLQHSGRLLRPSRRCFQLPPKPATDAAPADREAD